MRRNVHNRLWTIILTLLLCGASMVSVPRFVRAEVAQGEAPPSPPPDPNAGDPDWPTGSAKSPKPGPGRGGIAPVSHSDGAAAPTGRFVWMYKFRFALMAAFRSIFRIF